MTGDVWYGLLSIQTQGTKVSGEEAFAGLNLPSRFYMEMGLLKNDIGLEDFFSSRDRLFTSKSPARELAGALGYRGTDPGIRLYRDPKSDPWELILSVHLPDGNVAPQAEIVVFYRVGSARKCRLGVSASYLPLRTVDILTGEGWQQNLYLSAGVADLSSPFRFLGEATAGTVIERSPAVALLAGRPIPRWFLGADLQAGMALPWDGEEFVPALRASFLMPAMDEPGNIDLSFSLGGSIGFQGGFRVCADGGAKATLHGGTVTIGLIWALNGSLDLQ